jgi:hypothetical protein
MGFGSFAGGVAKGWQAADEMETAAVKRELIKAQTDEHRAKVGSEKELRSALAAGGLPGFKRDSGNTENAPSPAETPAPIERLQNVGGNYTADPEFANSMAATSDFASGADEPGSEAAKAQPTTAYQVKGAGVFNDPAAAIDASQATASPPTTPKAPSPAGDAYGYYRRNVVPRITSAFIKAGKMQEAKAFLEFTRDAEGEGYARDWLTAGQAVEAGDFEGAIPALGRLYNQSVPDGRRASWEHSGDGKYIVRTYDENTGTALSQREFSAPDLAKFALNSLAPSKRVEHMLSLQKESRAETRKLNQQNDLEDRRDARADTQEDRREDRLQTRLDAQSENLDRRLAAGGGPTLTQERGNAEIDAARERIASMDPAEVKRRSQKATNTGRENPDYDPSISRAAGLAGRRKVGDDSVFDKRQEPQGAPVPQSSQSRFAADPAMKGFKMGKRTPHGYEVLDASGKLLGHYD